MRTGTAALLEELAAEEDELAAEEAAELAADDAAELAAEDAATDEAAALLLATDDEALEVGAGSSPPPPHADTKRANNRAPAAPRLLLEKCMIHPMERYLVMTEQAFRLGCEAVCGCSVRTL